MLYRLQGCTGKNKAKTAVSVAVVAKLEVEIWWQPKKWTFWPWFPIHSFRQFFARAYCFATVQNVTDWQTTGRQMTQCTKGLTDSMVGQECFNKVLTWRLIEQTRFLCLFVLPGSAETLFRWGGKISQLLIAPSLSNACAKNIKIEQSLFKLQLKMSGLVFLQHSVVHFESVSVVCDTGSTSPHLACGVTVIIF